MTYNTTKEAGSELKSDSTPEPTGILANIYKQYINVFLHTTTISGGYHWTLTGKLPEWILKAKKNTRF